MVDNSIERPDLLLYAAEKLAEAVQILATDPCDVRGRLLAAAPALAMVPPSGLPAPLRAKYEALWQELTKNPEGEPKFGATFRKKRLTTLAQHAQRIHSLQAELDYFCQQDK